MHQNHANLQNRKYDFIFHNLIYITPNKTITSFQWIEASFRAPQSDDETDLQYSSLVVQQFFLFKPGLVCKSQ